MPSNTCSSSSLWRCGVYCVKKLYSILLHLYWSYFLSNFRNSRLNHALCSTYVLISNIRFIEFLESYIRLKFLLPWWILLQAAQIKLVVATFFSTAIKHDISEIAIFRVMRYGTKKKHLFYVARPGRPPRPLTAIPWNWLEYTGRKVL